MRARTLFENEDMLKCTICDDNKKTVSDIRNMIEDMYKDTFDIDLAYSKEDLDQGSCEETDILIIDIDLLESDGINSDGIEIASRLKEDNPNIKVIFVSSFHEYAQDIFKADPVYYIQKPVTESNLKIAIDKACSDIERRRKDKFCFTVGSEIISVPMKDILFFESDKRLMKVILKGETYSFYSRVKDVESKLDSRFVKCHQSYIVNMEHISSMRQGMLVVDNGQTIPVSKTRSKSVKIDLTRFLGRTIA